MADHAGIKGDVGQHLGGQQQGRQQRIVVAEIGQDDGHRGDEADADPRHGVAHLLAVATKPAGHVAAFDEAVKVQAVGHAGVAVADFAPKDAKEHFGHGVGADHEHGIGRDVGVALDQEHGHPGQCKADKVGTAVAHEEFAQRPVDPKKAKNAGGQQQGGLGQGGVAQLPGHGGVAQKAQGAGGGGQTMKAVNDVDAVGHAAHSKGGKQDRAEGEGKQPVGPPDVHTADRLASEPPGHQARDHGGQQTQRHAHALGDVFDQAKQQCGQASQQERACDLLHVGAGLAPGHGQADRDGDAAHTGGGMDVEFLDAVGRVQGVAAVPALGEHQQDAEQQGRAEGPQGRLQGGRE